MDYLLQYVIQYLQYLFQQLTIWLSQTIGSLIDYLANLLSSLYEWFAQVVSGVVEWFNGLVNSLTEYIGEALTYIKDVAVKLFESFAAAVGEVIDGVYDYVANVFSEIQNLATDIVDTVKSWLDGVTETISNLIQAGIDFVSQLYENAVNTIDNVADALLNQAFETVDAVKQKLLNALDTLIVGVGSAIGKVGEKLVELKEGFIEASMKAVTKLTEETVPIIEGIEDTFKGVLNSLTLSFSADEIKSLTDHLLKLNSGKGSTDELKQFVAGGWRAFVPSQGIGAILFFTLISIAGSVLFFGQAANVQAQIMLQDLAKEFPFALLSTGEAAQAYHRGLLSESGAVEAMQRQGYSPDNAKRLLKLGEQYPAPFDAMAIWHRGFVPEETLDASLDAHAIPAVWQDALKKASFVIPPVQDIITMAVREAFSPAIAQQFGQYEDFPEQFAFWADKQGLTEDWAKRYWAAHWSLPSPMQGFEMLHRGVIKEPELNLLLRALDVMPFWRDKLTAIAFAPYTRVDIRRMHKVGILTPAEVTRAYKDIGYDDEKAQNLTKFTLALNDTSSTDDDAELKTLSRSSILGFFQDGLITEQRAKELLESLGYSPDAAQLYIQSVILDLERKERNEEVAFVLDLAKSRLISVTEAEGRLARIGLETGEIAKALNVLVREQEKRNKVPSKTDAEKMYKAGLITLNDYKRVLESEGYADKWIDAYVGLLEKPTKA